MNPSGTARCRAPAFPCTAASTPERAKQPSLGKLAFRSVNYTAARLLGVFVVSCLTVAHASEVGPIFIGQSLPLRGASFYSADRVLQGAEAYVGQVNATGGIGGRKIELVTMDDEGDLGRLESNVRTMVRDRHIVALVNCFGDRLCGTESRLANELRIPLVGPLSGANSLRATAQEFTFPLRPRYSVQTDALQRQMLSMGIKRVALLSSYPATAELRVALLKSFSTAGTPLNVIAIDGDDPAQIGAAAVSLNAAAPDAVLLDVSHEVMRQLGMLENAHRFTWPRVLATVSAGTLTQLTQEIRSRIIGFVNVVPNPEDSRYRLVRELDAQSQRFGGPQAVTFEGIESYINLRVLVEAIRRAGPAVSPASVRRSMESLEQIDVGGFSVHVDRANGGPTWVDVGLRSRDGVFMH